jgi:hypothetical protein
VVPGLADVQLHDHVQIQVYIAPGGHEDEQGSLLLRVLLVSGTCLHALGTRVRLGPHAAHVLMVTKDPACSPLLASDLFTCCICQGADIYDPRRVFAELLLGGKPAKVYSYDLRAIFVGQVRGNTGWLCQATCRGGGMTFSACAPYVRLQMICNCCEQQRLQALICLRCLCD